MLKKRLRKEQELRQRQKQQQQQQGREKVRQDYYWPRCWHPLRLGDILSHWLIKSVGVWALIKAAISMNSAPCHHPAYLPPTKQKSLLPMNLMPPPPSPSPATSPVSFESVSCFVSFSDKFFHGFCLLLSHFFFLLFFFFFLLLFLCDFVFCHKLHWSTSPATCRCKDAPQFPTWYSCTLCFFLYFPLPFCAATCHVNLWRFCCWNYFKVLPK